MCVHVCKCVNPRYNPSLNLVGKYLWAYVLTVKTQLLLHANEHRKNMIPTVKYTLK